MASSTEVRVGGKKLDADVISALRSIVWDGNAAKLTCGQLDRTVYVKVNKALESLGGKWNRKAQSHLFSDDASAELEAIIESGDYVDRKQALGFFETPDELADEIVRLADIKAGMLCLEPSAGTGQLLRAARRAVPDSNFIAVEIDERHRKELNGQAVVVIRDFLGMNVLREFAHGVHRVVMNPPFAPRQSDIDHVLHAWEFLARGGRLVAITSIGWTFRTNRKSVEFQRFVARYGDRFDNDDDAFKSSGTMIKTCTIVLDKPETQESP